MAKSQSKPPKTAVKAKRTPLKWSVDEEASLLAWIDLCRENGLDFDDTVVAHMKTKWKKEFDERNIERKVKHQWEVHGLIGTVSKDYVRLKSEGTAWLDSNCIAPAKQLAINSAREELGLPKIWQTDTGAQGLQHGSRETTLEAIAIGSQSVELATPSLIRVGKWAIIGQDGSEVLRRVSLRQRTSEVGPLLSKGLVNEYY